MKMMLIDVDVLKRKETEEAIHDCDQCITTYSITDNTLDIPDVCQVCGANLRPTHYKWEGEEDKDE